jgi:hypothetical protein
MEILGGAWIFLAAVIFLTFAIIHGLYSRSGSGINARPFHSRYGDAPGADRDYREGLSHFNRRGTR